MTMKIIKVFIEEHEEILRLLDYLAIASEKIVQNQGPPKSFFEDSMYLCRDFADKFHHYKEEHLMFAHLAQKHQGQIDGEIERHRNQHEQLRDLIQQISVSLDGYSKKLDSKTRIIHRNLRDYVQTLRSHIQSENDILFPMVEEVLSNAEDEMLSEEFRKYEEKTGIITLNMFRSRISELEGYVK